MHCGRVRRTVVFVIRAVAVVIVIALIAGPVIIEVGLVGVVMIRAIIVRVVEVIAVPVEIAQIAFAVSIEVALLGIEKERTVVGAVGNSVAIHICVTGISGAVPIEVLLCGVGNRGAIVIVVINAVRILVLLHAISDAIQIGVRVSFVHRIVTVVVEPVAHLVSAGMGSGIEGKAVQRVDESVAVIVFVYTVGEFVSVGISESFVAKEVAVVVLAVAHFQGSGKDLRVQGIAVSQIGEGVVVVVFVADISRTVEIEIELVEVGIAGAVVQLVGHRILIVVITYAICNTVTVTVRKILVHFAVAIVVLAIALLFDRGLAIAEQLAPCAYLDPQAGAENGSHQAHVSAQLFVGLSVAIVVYAVTTLFSRSWCGAIGQPRFRALPFTLADSPQGFDVAVGGSSGHPFLACAHPRFRNALQRRETVHALGLFAHVSIRAVEGVASATAKCTGRA